MANRAGEDLKEVSKETALVNIVALCDVDEKYLGAAKARFPQAKTFRDFRRLLEERDIDAVVVGTPDHTHAVATVAALRSGRHVYCEKPLTHTVSEARIVIETARRQKLVTQMGTQIHAGENYRRVVELIQSGAIGVVREVHVFIDVSYTATKPAPRAEVPAGLDWDLWLGPAANRPYSPAYVPKDWRRWWDFGGGTLNDFGCHHMDLPHWALGLHHASAVEVVDGPPVDAEVTCPWLVVRYEYPARGNQPPVKLTWYHGGKRPPHFAENKLPKWGTAGTLFVGDKGMLLADYNRYVLLPEKDFAGFTPPPRTIPPSIGHHKEWIEACRSGGITTCNFDYSGALAETVLLGNVAYRAGKRLEWDAKTLRAKNCPQADQFIQHHYRSGWRI